jgi:hypothetical protein
MGVTLLIGNKAATIPSEDEDPVQTITLPDAPSARGDDPPGRSNKRQMSYGAFQDFCAATGLTTILYQRVTSNHPGELPITENLVREIGLALRTYEAHHWLPAGFALWHDGHKARLRWLHWWMAWALRNCARPILANS